METVSGGSPRESSRRLPSTLVITSSDMSEKGEREAAKSHVLASNDGQRQKTKCIYVQHMSYTTNSVALQPKNKPKKRTTYTTTSIHSNDLYRPPILHLPRRRPSFRGVGRVPWRYPLTTLSSILRFHRRYQMDCL